MTTQANQASVSRVNPNGSAGAIWLTNHHRGRSPRELLEKVIETQDLFSAVYVVAWTNQAGVPKVQVFTMVDETTIVRGIVGQAPRVNRWPPLDKPL